MKFFWAVVLMLVSVAVIFAASLPAGTSRQDSRTTRPNKPGARGNLQQAFGARVAYPFDFRGFYWLRKYVSLTPVFLSSIIVYLSSNSYEL